MIQSCPSKKVGSGSCPKWTGSVQDRLPGNNHFTNSCTINGNANLATCREDRKRSYSEGPTSSPTEKEPADPRSVLPLLQRSVRRSKKKVRLFFMLKTLAMRKAVNYEFTTLYDAPTYLPWTSRVEAENIKIIITT